MKNIKNTIICPSPPNIFIQLRHWTKWYTYNYISYLYYSTKNNDFSSNEHTPFTIRVQSPGGVYSPVHRHCISVWIKHIIVCSRFSDHGSTFEMDCNTCNCFAGEITCTKKHCEPATVNAVSRYRHTGLPCNCAPHHVPVCGSNGNTYPNSCLAKWVYR